MKTKKIIFSAFALIVLLIPMYMIFQSEDVLTNGHRHKLRLQGYDPLDPFRGKFLRLRFENRVPYEAGLKEGDIGFVLLEKDTSGFSYFSYVQKNRPSHSDYVEAKVELIYAERASMDFDNLNKFFINEDKAKEAEVILSDYTDMASDKIYLTIRILDGEARIEDIIVKAKTLLNYIESGDHKTFKDDIMKEMMERMERENKLMEDAMREQLEWQEAVDSDEFLPPVIDESN
ncbi:MAG: GDYXXLXY domain-containing protein [Fluviicola sp.]|nr:GDYXXLXY domain-containing protein [Fluviicola sp.]